jgi:hypothetical protein
MRRWLRLIDQIERYAWREGCERVVICGRRGWARMLPAYREAARIIERRR